MYSDKDFALIIPTKDRPEKMKNLIDSIVAQEIMCGQIIVVDGGESIEDLLAKYANKIPVEYYVCHPPGQIRQRNLAISKLKPEIKLVVFLDDDLVLDDKAFAEMLKFWNSAEKRTAGVSFNIVNNPPFKHTWYKSLIGMSSKKMGTILKSGYNVPISPVMQNIETQWLCGGATVWRKEIIEKYINIEVQSRWAICEDITFSYPIGKMYPMYVCASAKVRHEHVYDHNTKVDHIYYGRTATLWRLYFVESNEQLSRFYFFFMISAQIVFRIVNGVVFRKKEDLSYAIGQLIGMKVGIGSILKKKKLSSVLEEKTE